jgi:hypothetical protein
MPEGARGEHRTKCKAISTIIPTSDGTSYSGFNIPYLYYKHFSCIEFWEKKILKIFSHKTSVSPVKYTALK